MANANLDTNDVVLPHGMSFETRDGRLTLVSGDLDMCADFERMLPRLKQSALAHEMLVKAARIKGMQAPLKAIDATAGFGEDSILLAAAGFDVTLFERDQIIAALLADAIGRATQSDQLSHIAARMHLIAKDSIAGLANISFEPDVILLDPMFPAKRKDALAKKKLQLIQRLESPCSDEDALMAAALAANPKKIVVKRPLKGPHLAGKTPSYSLQGKTIRYDVIVVPH